MLDLNLDDQTSLEPSSSNQDDTTKVDESVDQDNIPDSIAVVARISSRIEFAPDVEVRDI